MHEFGIVEGLVHKLLADSRARGVRKITSVHFRRGSAFDDASLHQAFEAVTAETEAKGATLQVDVVNLDHKCECGHEQVITSDDLEGHMYVCPECGAIREVEESHDLELLFYSDGTTTYAAEAAAHHH